MWHLSVRITAALLVALTAAAASLVGPVPAKADTIMPYAQLRNGATDFCLVDSNGVRAQWRCNDNQQWRVMWLDAYPGSFLLQNLAIGRCLMQFSFVEVRRRPEQPPLQLAHRPSARHRLHRSGDTALRIHAEPVLVPEVVLIARCEPRRFQRLLNAGRPRPSRSAAVSDECRETIDAWSSFPTCPLMKRTTLEQFLDFHRHYVLAARAGVSDVDAGRELLPATTLAIGGIVKHLARVEDPWFSEEVVGSRDAGTVGVGAI